MVAATYETLIGLLAATGMRISEAIKLDRTDVDWAEAVLLVRESKFGKSRYLPLHHSTLEALAGYPDAFSADQPVYVITEAELQSVCGAAICDELAAYCQARPNGEPRRLTLLPMIP